MRTRLLLLPLTLLALVACQAAARLTGTPVREVPAFSIGDAGRAEGARIAFTSTRDGHYEVYVMRADGNGQTELTNDPAYDVLAAWKP